MRNPEQKQHIRNCRSLVRAFLTLPDYSEKVLDMHRCAQIDCIDMDRVEYERFKQEIQTRYDRKVDEAKDEYDKSIKSLENVWMIAQGMQPTSSMTGEMLTWPQMVQQILPKLTEPFTRLDAENAVRETFKDAKLRKNSLGGVMTRL